MTQRYAAAYLQSQQDPDGFWMAAAGAIDWVNPPTRAYDGERGWYPGATLNTAYNCIDRHLAEGRGGEIALIYDSPVTGQLRRYSYSDLFEEVGRVSAMLAAQGVGKGDRVVIYMPMVPETVFAMLACARLGAVHSVVFGGFAAPELAKRIGDATPKLLLTASCGIEASRVIAYKPLVDDALDLAAHKVDRVIVFQRDQCVASLNPPRDLDWAEELAVVADDPDPEPVAVASDDPLYILYTSGTTGVPKGVVRENGGHAVALAWSMANIYAIGPGDVFWAASDVGWVVGHSYIVYAPLLVGATTVLFEGKPVGTPDPGTFWRVIRDHRVKSFFTAPTAIRAIRKEDPDARFLVDFGTNELRAIFLAGERADPDTLGWLEDKSGLPVFDHWWQTELGWPAIATCFALGDTRRKRGSAGFPVPGYRFAILGEDGREVADGDTGAVTIAEPLPPGCFRTLWNNHAGYTKNFASFPGYYETGDAGHRDSEGFLHIMGRTDDIINVAGHRLSTGQMEQIVAAQDGVAECAVVGAADALKGQVPVAFAVARAGVKTGPEFEQALVGAVREALGPVAALKRVYIVDGLPKTRSGKILRNLLRALLDGEAVKIPATIEDPNIVEALSARIASTDEPAA